MKIWVDGDACPNKIKDILYKASARTKTIVTIVANHYFRIPSSPFIKRLMVGAGFDVADTKIIQQLEKGDLVITADIPLANEAVQKKATVLSPRGKLYDEHNIKQALAMRDFYTSLRESGVSQTSETAISPLEVRQFANHLDRLLTQS